jgi:hypothetical protein
MRDDFSKETKELLARRVGMKCSNPDCGQTTSGPCVDENKSINIGVAAHISAASPEGARFNDQISKEQRSSFENGIWLCQNCAKLIDNDPIAFPVSLLYQWKVVSEDNAINNIKNRSATLSNQSINAAVVIQGPNAINISGPNAVNIGPGGIQIIGPIINNS